ncbi:MAG: hypothetical protein RI560_03430 [Natronomonas sp.]|nr:hypothetical protein [Natronomonas sp.]
MSADGPLREQLLTGETLPEHLTTDPEVRVAPDMEVDSQKGLFYCRECHRRITRNDHNHNEYGHDSDCSHSQGREVSQ